MRISYDIGGSTNGWFYVRFDSPPYPDFDDMLEWCYWRFGECHWRSNPQGLWTLHWKERPTRMGFRNSTDAMVFLLRWS